MKVIKDFLLATLAASALLFSTNVYAQMADDAVVKYVQTELDNGKSQEQIGKELLLKGVTKAQLMRIKDKVESSNKFSAKTSVEAVDIQRLDVKDENLSREGITTAINASSSDAAGISPYNPESVFGRDIFRSGSLTFGPNLNLATPQDYRLGPGDQIIINVYGASEQNISQKITPDGFITVPTVGPINLNGLTVKAARERICAKLSKIYSGLNQSDIDVSTNVQVSVGAIKTVQVNIIGEVETPGTYVLSSFATVFHALHKAGGVNSIGSLREIKVIRGGNIVATIDVYDYLLRGKSSDDIRVQDADVILVSPYQTLAQITGSIKRPMYYELKHNETLADLIRFAGGFKGDAYTEQLTIDRSSGVERSVTTIAQKDFSYTLMLDGDKIEVRSNIQLYANRLEIKGAVYRPGIFELSDNIKTVKSLIESAGGLMDDAFTNRAVLHRHHKDKSLEVIPVDIKGILSGKAANIELMKNDVLYIPSVTDLKEYGEITVLGDVYAPGSFPFAENTTLEDIIIQAGGLRVSASTARVDVSRPIIDPNSLKKERAVTENFTFAIKDGFVIDGQQGFILRPYDQVTVRTSPGYSRHINVHILGEVNFEGSYALSERNERLSDLIKRAGGITEFAFLDGATIRRAKSSQELAQDNEIQEYVNFRNHISKDSTIIGNEVVSHFYTIGINLEHALANPHSDYDVSLKEGDVINIPQYNNIVKISGAVNNNNAVTYNPKANLSYYIDKAGGYINRAKRNETFIIYANGESKKLGRNASASAIKPGSHIVVPNKGDSKWTTGMTISTMTATVSMLAVIASLINTLK